MLNVSVLCFTFWNCSLENVGNGIFKPLKIKIPCRGGGGGGGGGNLFKPRLRFAPSTVNSLSPSCVLHAKCRLCHRAPTFCKECSSLKTRFTLFFYWDVAFFFSTEISWIKIQIRGGGTAGGIFYSVCLVTSLQIINALLEPRSHPALPSRVRGDWVLVNQPNHGAAGTHQ